MAQWMFAFLVPVALLVQSGGAVRGVVTGVRADQASVDVGAPVHVTVSGSNPCGAAFIDYGDGTAITYAITSLPTTQAHAYQKPGSFIVAARGMGNCDGQVTTRLQVTGQPAPPPPPAAPAITGVSFDPRPGVIRQPVSIVVAGHGTCAFTVAYGDGNQQDFTAALPKTVTHTYAVPNDYTVVVFPAAPCSGKFTDRLQVATRGGIRITDLTLTPSPAVTRQSVTMNVAGTGTCSYKIDFGDGNSEERSKALPDRVFHVYGAPGTYSIVVTGSGSCSGRADRALDVR
jgi:hypothetical protein